MENLFQKHGKPETICKQPNKLSEQWDDVGRWTGMNAEVSTGRIICTIANRADKS